MTCEKNAKFTSMTILVLDKRNHIQKITTTEKSKQVVQLTGGLIQTSFFSKLFGTAEAADQTVGYRSSRKVTTKCGKFSSSPTTKN